MERGMGTEGQLCPLAHLAPQQSQRERESRREGQWVAQQSACSHPRDPFALLPWTIPVLIMEPIREWV